MAPQSRHDSAYTVQAPVHPVPQLQGPFEESMLESISDDSDPDVFLDPITRRNILLEAPTYVRVVAGRWKQKPGERFHPLWKLIAQISFGIQLLAEGMAKSEDDVMQILQAHVDEIDGFLERTTEDFDLAAEDIQERLRCLKLPLSHPATFDRMLEDRNFRLSIVDGNEKIEHIVDRTTRAMKDSLKDVQKGFDSTSSLEGYLHKLGKSWQRVSVEHEAVYVAMLGNVEGWRKAFLALHTQGNRLGGALKKLTDIINEMQARAGEVSRRLLHQAKVQHPQAMGRPTGRSTPTSKFQTMPAKQLPNMPSRPPLRQAVSNDTVRSASKTKASSQESLRHQALLSRSQTPQDGMPAPRQVKNGASPRIIQIGSNPQARVQSMVPSLMESVPSTGESLVPAQTRVLEEEEPERRFPPVELPAHVPHETLQQAPMSKQNRLSRGFGTLPLKVGEQVEKRNSRSGTSALIDLLRAGPPVDRSSETLEPEPPEMSRSGSTMVLSSATEGFPPTSRAGSSPASSSVSDPIAMHTKTNVRRPKKGSQHWFEALDDELNDDDKNPVQKDDSIEANTLTIHKAQNPVSELGSEPSTPVWAVTSFAQAEKKKELLKKGAFSSHPPDLPPGSPPLDQNSSFPNPLTVASPARRLSHGSSVGQSTLGEPGPEITASEAGSASAHSGRYFTTSNDQNRASAYLPEVVMTESEPPLPVPSKRFVAEMEGSSPLLPGIPPPTTRDMLIELEAPQQYFALPPRPSSLVPAQPPTTQELQQQAFDQHFVQPLRLEPVPLAQSTPGTVLRSQQPIPAAMSNNDLPQMVEVGAKSMTTIDPLSTVVGIKPPPNPRSEEVRPQPASILESQPASGQITEQIVEFGAKPEHLTNSVFVSTPNIPIPPSPIGGTSYTPTDRLSAQPAKRLQAEPLYILPALAYQAPPISPRLPPDPIRRRSRGGIEPVVEAQRQAHSPPPPFAERSEEGQELNGFENEMAVSPPRNEPGLNLTTQSLSSESLSASNVDEAPIPVEKEMPLSASIVESQSASRTATSEVATGAKTSIDRDHQPDDLKHTRNSSSYGSQDEWKAFFTGQPSPIGSNLSIRSIKRESMMEHSQPSPALLSPGSASSRHPFPPSPVAGSDKDVVWFNSPVDGARPDSQRGPSADTTLIENTGLGITTAGSEHVPTKTINAAT